MLMKTLVKICRSDMTKTDISINTYNVVDLTGKEHTIHSDLLIYDEGMALFMNEDDTLVAMFKSPISVVLKAIDNVH